MTGHKSWRAAHAVMRSVYKDKSTVHIVVGSADEAVIWFGRDYIRIENGWPVAASYEYLLDKARDAVNACKARQASEGTRAGRGRSGERKPDSPGSHRG